MLDFSGIFQYWFFLVPIKGANKVEIEGYSKLSSKLTFGHWNPFKKAGANNAT